MREMTLLDSTPEDKLSYFLETISIKIVAAQVLHLESPWSFHVEEGTYSFYLAANGRYCLRIPGNNDIFRLESGDLVLLLYNRPHSLGDSPSIFAEPTDETDGNPRETGAALKMTLFSGAFKLDTKQIADLVPEMPSVIHIKHQSQSFIPWVIRTVKMISDEYVEGHAGARILINDLAHLVIVHAIRCYLASAHPDAGHIGEFINAPQIRKALYLMRTHPEEPWSVASIAKKCGMSRSAFADKFRSVVGKPPMEYLLALRMSEACDLLSKGCLSVKEISKHAGYGSQPAFNNAFRRWTGVAPNTYRQSHSTQTRNKGRGPFLTDV